MVQTGNRKGFLIEDILTPDFGSKSVSNSTNQTTNSGIDFRCFKEPNSEVGLSEIKDQNNASEEESGSGKVKKEEESVSGRVTKDGDALTDEINGYFQESRRSGFLPSWVYSTRYSDRPTSGSRSKKSYKCGRNNAEKRCRTAFTPTQLTRLQQEFDINRYLTDTKRLQLASDLELNQSQIKIWFQNKRAKLKKSGSPSSV